MRLARGFTLIELMITVAVIAILASIALPSYNDYVIRSKLTEAHTFLSDLRVKMEQRFQDSRAYNSPNSCITPSGSQVKYFTFSCPTLTANQYTLQAAGNAGSDLEGIAFTITESNVRATTVTAGSKMATKGYTSNSTCWVTKKGGIC